MIPNFIGATLLPDPIGDASEFAGRNGDCGQDVLAMLLRNARGQSMDIKGIQGYMNTLTDDMIRRGWAAANGAATLNNLKLEAAQEKASIDLAHYVPYKEPLDYAWLATNVFRPLAGVKGILVQTAQGGRLVDAWNANAHDEAGVRYHVYGIIGKLPDVYKAGKLIQIGGYICIDGDNPDSTHGGFPIYRLETIINAQPCGVMVINQQRPIIVVPPPVHVPPPPAKTYTLSQIQYNQLVQAAQAYQGVLAQLHT